MTPLSLDAIQAALRETTEALAHELAWPSAEAPEWSEQEWRIARATASMHGVSSLLATRLRWQGPEGWRNFLLAQRGHTMQRHQRILSTLGSLDERLRASGIAAVALKGAELHALGLYAPGERPMADIDLLVRETDVARTTALLSGLGLEETCTNARHATFEYPQSAAPSALGEHVRNDVKIELHTRIREELPIRPVDITARIFPRQAEPGLNRYPSNGALLLHLVLHAAGAMHFRALRLLHLQDFARLFARATDTDWRAFIDTARGQVGAMWWARPPLALASRYGVAVPGWVLEHPALRASHLLARRTRRSTLSDVSLSALRVTAFPGIEWSQSVGEMITYMKRRVLPSKDLLAARRYIARTQPPHAAMRWSRLSQRRRLLLWLTRSAPRSETLFAVETALSQSM